MNLQWKSNWEVAGEILFPIGSSFRYRLGNAETGSLSSTGKQSEHSEDFWREVSDDFWFSGKG